MSLHQSSSKSKSVNKINTGLGFVDTNKDKKHAKRQKLQCRLQIYTKKKKTKHKKVNIGLYCIQAQAAVVLAFNKYYLI